MAKMDGPSHRKTETPVAMWRVIERPRCHDDVAKIKRDATTMWRVIERPRRQDDVCKVKRDAMTMSSNDRDAMAKRKETREVTERVF